MLQAPLCGARRRSVRLQLLLTGGWLFLAAYACSGLAGLVYEVSWTRLATLYMGHTTAAASGLVARLANLGYVMRSPASDDRRKVMVCITPRGSALVRRIREEMICNLMKMMAHLSPGEQKSWLQIYSKIYDYCQNK
jgi:DNA-binding MarR family transcriptional regulator